MPKHELDTVGRPIHVDVDPFIPTGICAICTDVEQDVLAPEDRPEAQPETAE